MSELRAAFQLVHDSYVRAGYMKPHSSGLRCSLQTVLPTATTFVLYDESALLGTATIVIDSPAGLPSDGTFPEELGELRARDSLAEATMFAVDEGAGYGMLPALLLAQAVFSYAKQQHIGRLCLTVNPKHLQFYLRYFKFEQVSARRACPHVDAAPGVLLRRSCTGEVAEGSSPASRLLGSFPEQAHLCLERVWSPSLREVYALSRRDPELLCEVIRYAREAARDKFDDTSAPSNSGRADTTTSMKNEESVCPRQARRMSPSCNAPSISPPHL